MYNPIIMGIEFHPPALEGIINSSLAEKRLKNREGHAVATSQFDGEVIWVVSGRILDIYSQAITYINQNPSDQVTLVEYSCNSMVLPVKVPVVST